jgi:hypothetical protein
VAVKAGARVSVIGRGCGLRRIELLLYRNQFDRAELGDRAARHDHNLGRCPGENIAFDNHDHLKGARTKRKRRPEAVWRPS